MSKTNLNRAALIAGACLSLLAAATPALAFQIVPDCARGAATPTLNCALQTFTNIANLILGVTGSFALLMFVYGGFVMLTSAGVQDKVTKGKTILKNAVIGIFIILTAGYVIEYGLRILGGGQEIKSEGASCAAGDTAGIYVTVGGNLTCVVQCSGVPGYSCIDAKSGHDCLPITCPGGAGQSQGCCLRN